VTVDIPGPDASFVLLGTVVRPHGIRGELKVRPWTERPENICRYQRLYLAAEPGDRMIECTGLQARLSGNMVILRLEQCADRDRAEQLVGLHLWLATSDLPPAGADELYLHTLMHKRARTTTGQALGTVRAVLSSGQDVLVIGDGDHEYLVPAIWAFIASVDETEVVLDLPPGLLDINR